MPYGGSGPMRLDFLAGVVPAIFDAVPQNLPAVQDGTAVPLAVTALERLSSLPDVPTFRELGHDVVADNWLGVSAPAGVPADIRMRLDAALQDAMTAEDILAQFDTWGLVRVPMTSEGFSAYVADQLAQWTPMVQSALE